MNTTKHYGPYGGQYVAETLMGPLNELAAAYLEAKEDPEFQREFAALLKDYVGRESPITVCRRLSAKLGGATIALKREDLNHTGAHKVNNTIGQALLAKRMGKKRLIAETGAGMHGVATATVAALLGMPCEVYMGAIDVKRQAPNVERMKMLGATVHAIEEGSATLKDAMNEALRDWVTNCDDTFYVIGTAAGPYPYPEMVKDFQSVIGREARRQCLEKFGRLPDQAIACVGGGSNAIGLFAGFLDDAGVKLVGVEAAGRGIATGEHAASINGGRLGVLHGAKTMLLQTADGNVIDTYSVSAGLDYPGVGPEHCYLHDTGRAEYSSITDDEAIAAFDDLCRYEGIIPALESSHALAEAEEPLCRPGHVKRLHVSARSTRLMTYRTKTMKHRITECFAKAKSEGRGAFVAYMTIGYPTLEKSEAAVETLISEGADIIELGVPFSDPFADGAVIRAAAYEALRQGVTLHDVIALAKRVRSRHPETGLVLFSYYNLLFANGLEKFADEAADAGIDAVLAVDLPLEERDELLAVLKPRGMSYVPLIAPNTPIERVKASAEGLENTFLYVITVKGITGARKELPKELSSRLDEVRAAVKLPIAAGFGISSKEQADEICRHADGYIIGSALVKRFGAD